MVEKNKIHVCFVYRKASSKAKDTKARKTTRVDEL